jgi:CMD domain protein
MISPTIEKDLINSHAGIAPGSKLAELRAQRAEVARAAQATFEALLEPADPAGVSRVEREMVALRIALLTRNEELAQFHRERLQALGGAEAVRRVEDYPSAPATTTREGALLRHVDRLSTEPDTATKAHLDQLQAQGFTPRDLVTIGQLIAFMHYQVRLLAGLRALGEEA